MRTYYIYTGSVPYFDKVTSTLDGDELSEVIARYDQSRNLGNRFRPSLNLIVRNNQFLNLTDSAHARIGGLIEDLTTDDAIVYIHNPTLKLKEHIESQAKTDLCEVSFESDDIPQISDIVNIREKIASISDSIVGQESALKELGKSLVYLSKTKRDKPFVFMFYGNSSLGKTETAKAIATEFYQGEMIEKHLSMFETSGYLNYLFGDKANGQSLGYDLMQRQSNLLFFDEIDKCPSTFHAAFYTLFDSSVFLDGTYSVDIRNLVIILTCNYLSETDIQKNLGDPIYNRIDKCIKFVDLEVGSLMRVLDIEVAKQTSEVDADIEVESVRRKAAYLIPQTGSNARTVQRAVRQAIEDLLYEAE